MCFVDPARTARNCILVLLVCALLAPPIFGQSGVITTVAGNGSSGFSGDGGPATAASFDNPAGNGTIPFSGDGIAATSSSLNSPFGLALDSAGNLYIADELHHRVRKVTPAGIITTVSISVGIGQTLETFVTGPTAILIDGGNNLFIADIDRRILRLSVTRILTTIAGTGTAGFSDMVGRPPRQIYRSFLAWQSTPPATCTSHKTHSVSERSRPLRRLYWCAQAALLRLLPAADGKQP
jgi:hypothetical protein